ncbi:hypothetical protein [Amycolatopsis sp. NPDC059021]|uniref:hypothetical protein n=1 Tax=Amycolatopsis sp. NPDC059021 TaxID=3346704 RepID=UPI00366EF253
MSYVDMLQINNAINDLDRRIAALEAANGKGDWTLTQSQNVPAGVNTRLLFQQQNEPPVGIAIATVSYVEANQPAHSASEFTILSSGRWDIRLDARWTNGGGATDRYVMIGSNTGVFWGKNSSSGANFNLHVATERDFFAGEKFNAYAYNGSTSQVEREGDTLITRLVATQRRAA